MKNLVLIGFPGAGKTSIGKSMADQLHLSFTDLDQAIEETYHITIPYLFEKYGEFAFRRCEAFVLQKKLTEKGILIATGGGTPCFEESMTLINQSAISIYLKAPEEQLVAQLLSDYKSRPLLQGLDEAGIRQFVRNYLPLRAPYYEQAHFTMDGTEIQKPEYLARVLTALNSD